MIIRFHQKKTLGQRIRRNAKHLLSCIPPFLAKRLEKVYMCAGDYFTTYFLPFLMSTPLAFLPTRWPARL